MVEVTASCSTGFRGHSCQAPALVPVEVELRTKVNEVGNMLAVNRARYLEIRSGWTNQSRWINLGNIAYKLTFIAEQLSVNNYRLCHFCIILFLSLYRRRFKIRSWKVTAKQPRNKEKRCSTRWFSRSRHRWHHFRLVHELQSPLLKNWPRHFALKRRPFNTWTRRLDSLLLHPSSPRTFPHSRIRTTSVKCTDWWWTGWTAVTPLSPSHFCPNSTSSSSPSHVLKTNLINSCFRSNLDYSRCLVMPTVNTNNNNNDTGGRI